jgi:hypothetical protein
MNYQNYIRYFQSGAADRDVQSQVQHEVINLCDSDDDNEDEQQQFRAKQSAPKLNKGYYLGL